jgi:NADPH2 dehydrogenase
MPTVNSPISINHLSLDGRIIKAPVAVYLCTEDGQVTDKLLQHYAAVAANPNLAAIITEHSYIAKRGQAKSRQLSIVSDDCVPGLTRLVDTIHAAGSKAICQISHAGSGALAEVTGTTPVAPSAVVSPTDGAVGDGSVPEALTCEGIQQVVAQFAAAAGRAKAAGYDGVEIHSAHAYLLDEFYSPLANQREDEYGGALAHRLRIHGEVIRAVRATVGPDYPVLMRLGACDYQPGGATIDDAVAAARVFEAAGVDAIDVSGGMCRYLRPGHKEPGYFRDASMPIREAVDIPVIVAGGVKTLTAAQTLLDEGVCDIVSVGRALLRDPNWETMQA